MKPILSALATAVLIGSSLLFGAGAANATGPVMPGCPPNTHLVMDPGSNSTGTCVRDPRTAPTAPIACSSDGNTCLWNGTPPRGPAPVNAPAPPPYKPLPQAPAPVRPPAAPPAAPARNVASGAVPAQGSFQAGQPAGTMAGAVPAQQVAAPADVPAEAAPAAAPAIVLPANEAQAVDALRSATATAAEKEAALAIVKAKVESVLDLALSRR